MSTVPNHMEQMNIVIVGHVDHGKSTLVGRLLADTKSLPEGKLEQIKLFCEKNAKPFEYAFLLDALKDEQSQGITIDTARCFFKTEKRYYIIIDAPGHIEFLKNMVTGAARAEAALLIIDAKEGVQENSRRHGYLLSMLGIKQVIVLINKMDLVDYNQSTYDHIVKKYGEFLQKLSVDPITFIPVSAFCGDNIASHSDRIPWYKGYSVLESIDSLRKENRKDQQSFRFPVQDIYKFTENSDDRRIIAGTISTGSISLGDHVTFHPSGKVSKIASIESFNTPTKNVAYSGESVGFTLSTQVYLKAGELMVKTNQNPQPHIGRFFRSHIFWLGKHPMITNQIYKLKLATTRVSVYLRSVHHILDASSLEHSKKQVIHRHDVADCLLETVKPISYDLFSDIEDTGRFVIIDDYEISGGGIITESSQNYEEPPIISQLKSDFNQLLKSSLPISVRKNLNPNEAIFIVVTGSNETYIHNFCNAVEKFLVEHSLLSHYVGIPSNADSSERALLVSQISLIAWSTINMSSIFILGMTDIDDIELDILRLHLPKNCRNIILSNENSLLKKYFVDIWLKDNIKSDSELLLSSIFKTSTHT